MLLTPVVEAADADDLETLATLRTEQGWQRSDLLLSAVHSWQGGRIFIIRAGSVDTEAENPRAVIASTSAVVAGAVGVIGTVMVRADFRRRGLARLLMTTCLRWIREQGAGMAFLDATADGRPLYFDLGFVGVAMSHWGHAHVSTLADAARRRRDPRISTSLYPRDELRLVADLDSAAFGGDRLNLIAHLLSSDASWLYIAARGGAPAGFAVVRQLDAPYVGIRIGPWVATDDDVATELVRVVTADDATWRGRLPDVDPNHLQVFASIPGTNKRATHLFEALGGTLEEDDLIMRLDWTAASDAADDSVDGILGGVDGQSHLSPAIEHPEWLYSWIAPMVF